MENSWAQTIHAYDQSRRALPWKTEEFIPAHNLTLRERRDKERELDPILMKYRDPNKEESSFQQTQTKILEKKAVSMSRSGQKYNLITHQGPKPISIDLSAKRAPGRDWNLLSHFSTNLHSAAPLKYDHDFSAECIARSHPTNVSNRPKYPREFSVISNEFYENNESKKYEEAIKMNKDIEEKYWKTHSFDPIKVEYYDEEKEIRYLQERPKKLMEIALQKEEALPYSTYNSEGKAYNILTNQAINEEKFKTSRTVFLEDRKANKYKGRTQRVADIRNQDLENTIQAERRKLSSASFERWRPIIDRGYDPILSTDVTALKPFPLRPTSVWDKLHATPMTASKDGSKATYRDLSSIQGASMSDTFFIAASSGTAFGGGREILSSPANVNINKRSSSTISPIASTRIPSLSISKAETGVAVKYNENISGPPGVPIAMVRTGGGLTSFD